MAERKWRGAKQLTGDKTSADQLHVFRDGKSLCLDFEDAEEDGSGILYTPFGWPGAKYCHSCREANKVPEGQKRPTPYKMKPYGHDTGLSTNKPDRFDLRTGHKTSEAERKRVKRKPRKAARRQAKKEIEKETP